MSETTYHPWLHRFAVLTTVVALLPVSFGAMTTTEGAGMAFPDWPTSDGESLLFYPWFNSAGDKFLEHGHRLAGALIGIFSIGLVAMVWKFEKRLSVTIASVVVLLSVIAQGILGGLRVLENDPRLAMLHGLFAAVVFALMGAIALVTSRQWLDAPAQSLERDPSSLKAWSVVAVGAILSQYALGGLLRHLGTALFEHMGLAVIVLLCVIGLCVVSFKQKLSWLARPAWMMLFLVFLQLSLGMGAFITKYGFKATGLVAVQGTLLQSLIRTSHTIIGMLLFVTAVSLMLRVFRLSAIWTARHPDPLAHLGTKSMLPMEGGLP